MCVIRKPAPHSLELAIVDLRNHTDGQTAKEDCRLTACDVLCFGRDEHKFRREVKPPSSVNKNELYIRK